MAVNECDAKRLSRPAGLTRRLPMEWDARGQRRDTLRAGRPLEHVRVPLLGKLIGSDIYGPHRAGATTPRGSRIHVPLFSAGQHPAAYHHRRREGAIRPPVCRRPPGPFLDTARGQGAFTTARVAPFACVQASPSRAAPAGPAAARTAGARARPRTPTTQGKPRPVLTSRAQCCEPRQRRFGLICFEFLASPPIPENQRP